MGGEGDDWLRGDEGDDVLGGGAGSDVLFGGLESDLFVYDGGFDLVMDLEEREIVQVSGELGGGISAPEDVRDRAVDLRDSTLIDFGDGNSLYLNGVAFDNFTTEPGKYLSIV